ncbi:MAG: response regulator [Bacteriovorax sp.]
MKKILIIEDETPIRKLLRVSLEANGYQIIEAETGQKGLQKILENKPEIILLDLGLPDKSGLEILKEIRQWSQTPIIILTVVDNAEVKVEALDGGADDYITKPFNISEVLVRIRVALRHASPVEKDAILKCGPIEMDLSGHVVKINSQQIKLTTTEYDILKVLIRHKGKVVTHRMLLNEVWGQNSTEHVHYLRVYLGNLRKKLKIEGTDQELISTEAGVGYRLIEN